MVWRAAAAIESGVCSTVICVLGEAFDPMKMAMLMSTASGLERSYEDPYGPMGASSGYALVAHRHAFEYGTTDVQRARVAVDQRTNACANPDALFYGKPITVDDVLNSRMIASPLHLLEVVVPCSGAAALVITSGERAKSLKHPPVYLLGVGEGESHVGLAYAPTITTSPIKTAAARAFKMAGVTPRDVDMVSAYDCFTITVLITLEDAGFCEKGEGGPFCEETDMTYKGKLPVNTHGGQLSFGQAGFAGGMSHVTEAVRQLRGETDGRQVPDCEIVYVNGNGGILGDECSIILGTASTL
ncbi:MAG: thiolase family protein [Chloroflexota bacterium]|nr:thiolase family protein [Chloroflexota bacterium]